MRKARLTQRLKQDKAFLDGGRFSSASASLSTAFFCLAVEIRVIRHDRVVVTVAARVERRCLGCAHGHGCLHARIVQHGHLGAHVDER